MQVSSSRRPENRIGPLMSLVGFMWFLGALNSANTAWAYTVGLLVGALWIGALVQMLVGTGLAGLADRVVALGGRLEVESPRGRGTSVRAELLARRA